MAGKGGGRVGVVGGGLGGLAAACTLAARGYRVVCLEKNSWFGGKAEVLESKGFRFDMGPTILTVPSVLARIFSDAGKEMADYLDLIPLDPQWRCFFSDGRSLDLAADIEKMTAAISAHARDSRVGLGYRRFMEISKLLHEISDRFFFWRSLSDVRETFELRSAFRLSVLPALTKLRMGRTAAGMVGRFVPDPQVAQMLNRFTQSLGSAPDMSPAVLCAVAHMQTEEGIWYPRGGTGAVPQALLRLAGELGVQVRAQTLVRKILIDGEAVRGVETESGESIPLDAVVSNCDAVRTHRELIDGIAAARFRRRRKYEPACSGVVLYLGLSKGYEHLLHHNFVFSRDAEEEFDAVYRRGTPAADPTCYVCAPARTEPKSAPPGGEALYVLVHTPYLRSGHDWSKRLPEYRRTILEKLSRTAGLSDLEERIVFEHSLTPEDIHRRYHVLDGAIYGLASHGRFLGAFKPSNRSPDVRGLYLAGGSAHPGPGMAMALMSGWIAADALDQDMK